MLTQRLRRPRGRWPSLSTHPTTGGTPALKRCHTTDPWTPRLEGFQGGMCGSISWLATANRRSLHKTAPKTEMSTPPLPFRETSARPAAAEAEAVPPMTRGTNKPTAATEMMAKATGSTRHSQYNGALCCVSRRYRPAPRPSPHIPADRTKKIGSLAVAPPGP